MASCHFARTHCGPGVKILHGLSTRIQLAPLAALGTKGSHDHAITRASDPLHNQRSSATPLGKNPRLVYWTSCTAKPVSDPRRFQRCFLPALSRAAIKACRFQTRPLPWLWRFARVDSCLIFRTQWMNWQGIVNCNITSGERGKHRHTRGGGEGRTTKGESRAHASLLSHYLPLPFPSLPLPKREDESKAGPLQRRRTRKQSVFSKRRRVRRFLSISSKSSFRVVVFPSSTLVCLAAFLLPPSSWCRLALSPS